MADDPPSRGPEDRKGPDVRVEIYNLRFCPSSMRAKWLLDRKGVTYNEYTIDDDETNRQVMIRRAEGRSTTPQIFINNKAIGGLEELQELERTGDLDRLLGRADL